jgi:hypothetical protein
MHNQSEDGIRLHSTRRGEIGIYRGEEMTHRTIAIMAMLIVFGLAVASTGCVARAQQPGINCDGYDRINGTLHYSCAIIDYDKLAELAPIFAGRGKVTQVWVKSDDPDVVGFIISATWTTPDVITGDWKMLARNGSQQTIFEFATGGAALQSVAIQELKAASTTNWLF